MICSMKNSVALDIATIASYAQLFVYNAKSFQFVSQSSLTADRSDTSSLVFIILFTEALGTFRVVSAISLKSVRK